MWIAGALCVAVCGSFAGSAVAHVIEERWLADSTAVPLLPQVVPPETVSPRGVPASSFLDRNLFCSDCRSEPGDPHAVTTTLPLVLVATSLGADPFATLRHLETGVQGAFWTGDAVPGAGVIEHVGGTFVLVRTGTGALARVDLLAIASASPAAPPPDPEARFRKLDDTTYEVDRQLVRDLVGAQAKVPGVRVTPAQGKDGKLRGVRIAQAKKKSLASELGLRTGDVIEALDGKALDAPEVLLEAYGQLERATQVRLTISRGGKPLEIEYRLR